MPFTIDEKDGVFFLRLFGTVSRHDFQEFATTVLRAEKSLNPIPPRITDMTEVAGVDLTFTDIWHLAEIRRSTTFPNPFKSAIVAPQDYQLGFARMFQTLNDHPQITIRIFKDLPSAQAWVAEN